MYVVVTQVLSYQFTQWYDRCQLGHRLTPTWTFLRFTLFNGDQKAIVVRKNEVSVRVKRSMLKDITRSGDLMVCIE